MPRQAGLEIRARRCQAESERAIRKDTAGSFTTVMRGDPLGTLRIRVRLYRIQFFGQRAPAYATYPRRRSQIRAALAQMGYRELADYVCAA